MISPLVQRILDSMKRNETQAALVEINRKLKGDKLSENDRMQLTLLKGNALLQLGLMGEAEQILIANTQKCNIFIINLAKELDKVRNVLIFKNELPLNDYYQLLICDHQFDEASKISLKLYQENKKVSQFFEAVILSMQNDNMGGKIGELFMDKLSKMEGCNNEQLRILKLSYYKHYNNTNKVNECAQPNDREIQMWLYQQSADFYKQMLESHYAVFRSHLNEEQFIMDFESMERVLNLCGESKIQIINDFNSPFEIVPINELPNHLYNSCLYGLTKVSNPLILKSLILFLLKLQHKYTLPQQEMINRFAKIAAGKYSFCSELFNTIPFQVIEFEQSSIIHHINYLKIHSAPIDVLLQEYHKHPVPEKVEKGDRLIQDDYMMMAIDNLFDVNDFDKCIHALVLIQEALKNSPYNYDFQLRQLIIYSELGLVEQCIEATTLLDIKGVQYDTIGFIFAKTYLEMFTYGDQVEKKNIHALLFYLENLRESKKNLINSFKTQNYEPFTSFHKFEKWIKNSYIKKLYYLVQCRLLQNKKQEINIQYFISEILKQHPLTISIDEKIFQSHTIRELNKDIPKYGNFLGIYSDPHQLELDALSFQLYQYTQEQNQEQLEQIIQQMQGQKIEQYEISRRNNLKNESQKINYLEDLLKFVQSETVLRLQISKIHIWYFKLSQDSLFNDFELNYEELFKLKVNSRTIARFFNYTYPMIILLIGNASEFKKKLFNLSKKAKGEQKGLIEKFSKYLLSLISELKQAVTQYICSLEIEQYEIKYGSNNFKEQMKQSFHINKPNIEEKMKLLKNNI